MPARILLGLRVGIAPVALAHRVRHQLDLRHFDQQDPRQLGELTVVADRRAHFAFADIKYLDFLTTCVVIFFVSRQMNLALFAYKTVGAKKNLRIVDSCSIALTETCRYN